MGEQAVTNQPQATELPGGTPAAQTATESLKKRVLRGSMWVTVGQAAGQLLRLVGNVVLAWLLAPYMFGLMMLVNATLRGLKMFSDVGLNLSIIQNPRGEEQTFLDTAWTLQILRGVLLFLIAAAISMLLMLAAAFELPLGELNKPILPWLLLAAASTALIGGFESTRIYTLNRRLEMGKLTALELSQQVVTLVVMVGLAVWWRSVWVLVIGAITAVVYRVVVSNTMLGGPRHRLAWERDALRALFGFAVWVLLATALTFLSNYADQYLLGALIGVEMLGVFAVARLMADAPREWLGRLTKGVILPAITTRARGPREELRVWVARHRLKPMLLLAVGNALAVAVSDQVILLLYDDRYYDASWMLPLLMLGLWPRILSNMMNPALLALGKPQWNTLGSVLKLVTVVVGLPLAYWYDGLIGAVAVVALSDVPNFVASAIGVAYEKISSPALEMLATVVFVVSLAILLGLRMWLGFGSPFGVLL